MTHCRSIKLSNLCTKSKLVLRANFLVNFNRIEFSLSLYFGFIFGTLLSADQLTKSKELSWKIFLSILWWSLQKIKAIQEKSFNNGDFYCYHQRLSQEMQYTMSCICVIGDHRHPRFFPIYKVISGQSKICVRKLSFLQQICL